MNMRDRIETARLKMGLSYAALAERAGLNDDTVRLYLQGRIDTATSKAEAMLKVVKDAEMEHNNEKP